MAQRSWSVLIVDDDFRVAGIHADIVEAAPGFSVQNSVRTVAEAHEAIRSSQPDFMLVDVYLPDGDGIELVHNTGIDAFILSAADEAATVRRAFRAGALGYLVKPFQRQLLLDRLDRYARYRHVLTGKRGLRQEKIDQALSILHGVAPSAPVSSSSTEQLLLDALGNRELSAAAAAEAAGVSRATAQRRLAAMAAQGVVHVRLNYGATGRPEHLYSKLA
ncbi:response regulator [Corynebacterium lubricantis]|uniref:response regulator n=1 Tax=Corynebacterium lubricantis TaxID=541095 RepID=UPI000376D9CF|nr:response regulator [Corynebacterium lubricantis]